MNYVCNESIVVKLSAPSVTFLCIIAAIGRAMNSICCSKTEESHSSPSNTRGQHILDTAEGAKILN